MLVHAPWPAHSTHNQAPQIQSLDQLAEHLYGQQHYQLPHPHQWFHINHIAARQQQGASTRRTVLQGTKQSGHHVVTDLFTLMTACLGQGQVHEQGTTALQGRHRDCIQMTELTHQPPDHTLFHHDGAYLVPATMQFC